MSAFQAVNIPLSAPPAPKEEEVKTPTTPRPNQFFNTNPSTDTRSDDPSAKTPTKASFAGMTEQKPRTEPTVTFGSDPIKSEDRVTTGNKRESLHRPSKSVDSIDTAMLDDDEGGADGSDNESTTDDGNRPSKKKKGQRFFCTDFPPCQLSFTRSEHLARHIRYVSSHRVKVALY
jgi:C2H2 transcription facotor